jgi:hypothetical protein
MIRIAALCLALAAGCGSSSGSSRDMSVELDMTAPNIDAGPPECDVVSDTGCMSGDKCTIGSDHGGARDLCFPVAANPVAEGGDCVSVTMGARSGDNCAAGLVCVDFPGDGAKCRRPCFVRGQCPTGSGCVVTTTSGTTATFDIGTYPLRACYADVGCDPVMQTVCSGGKACYLSGADDQGRVTACLTPQSTGTAGASCNGIAGCAGGFRCDPLQFCRRYCYFATATGGTPTTGQCPANEGACEPFYQSTQQYGVCGQQ